MQGLCTFQVLFIIVNVIGNYFVGLRDHFIKINNNNNIMNLRNAYIIANASISEFLMFHRL